MKHISNLYIENFRGFDALKINDLAKVNVLIGKNDVGKTSILEAIFMLSGMSNTLNPLNINAMRGILPHDIQNLQYLFHNLNPEIVSTLRADFTNSYSRQLQISPKERNITNLSDEKRENNVLSQPLWTGLTLNFSEKNRGDATEMRFESSLEYLANGIQHKADQRYTEEIAASFIHSESTRNNVTELISQIIKLKQNSDLLQLLQKFDPDIETFSLLPDGLYLGMKGVDKMMTANVAGNGLNKFIAIAAHAVVNKNTIILIDEIENGIHYSVYPLVWDALIEAAQQNDNQLFVTTHSREELTALQKILQDNAEYRDMTAVYMINKSEKRGFEAFRYGYEALDSTLKLGNEIRN